MTIVPIDARDILAIIALAERAALSPAEKIYLEGFSGAVQQNLQQQRDAAARKLADAAPPEEPKS